MTYREAHRQAKQERLYAWYERHGMEVFVGADGRFHAGSNGATGVNGEHYEPGQWVAMSEDTVKGMGVPEEEIRERAIIIAREDWESDPENAAVLKRMISRDWGSAFIGSLLEQLDRKGGLSVNQVAAAANAMDSIEQRERDRAERESRNAHSEYIGEIGKRVELDLVVERVIEYDSFYGTFVIYLMRAGDNVVVYKGGGGWAFWLDDHHATDGDTLRLRATVKEHSDRDGVKQTIISRPKQL